MTTLSSLEKKSLEFLKTEFKVKKFIEDVLGRPLKFSMVEGVKYGELIYFLNAISPKNVNPTKVDDRVEKNPNISDKLKYVCAQSNATNFNKISKDVFGVNNVVEINNDIFTHYHVVNNLVWIIKKACERNLTPVTLMKDNVPDNFSEKDIKEAKKVVLTVDKNVQREEEERRLIEEAEKKESSFSTFLSPDTSSPLEHLLLPNTHERFELNGREARFSCFSNESASLYQVYRSLIFGKGTSDGVLEMKIKTNGNWIYFGVISSSQIEICLDSFIGRYSCGASFHFYSYSSNFWCGGKNSGYFQKGGKSFGVEPSVVVTGVLDMREGKHTLHFLVGEELLPHAIVNIPNEKMHMGISTDTNVTVTLVCLSLCSSLPPMPFKKCIAYNYDGSNMDKDDFTQLKFEDGSSISNIKEYLK